MTIARHRLPARSTWDAINAIYRASFGDNQREDEATLAERVITGRYQLTVSQIDTQVVGFSLLDIVPEPSYAVLTYMAVAQTQRGKGIGGALCSAVVSEFQCSVATPWLLVEAERRQAAFYRNYGFQAFALDYRAPRFRSDTSIAMSLMAVPGEAKKTAASQLELCDIIHHIFVDGYVLSEDDPRLLAQLAAITDPTPLID